MSKTKKHEAIENAFHTAMRDLATSVWNEHRVRIKRVEFEWIDASTSVEDVAILAEVKIETMSKG